MIKSRTAHRFRDALLVMVLLGLALIPQSSQAMRLIFTDMQAVMPVSDAPNSGNRIVSPLVDSILFGRGGFAGDQIQFGAVGVYWVRI